MNEPIKLDLKDRKILHALDGDARLTYSQLAKITGISQETVRYRLNALVSSGVIKKFLTLINVSKLGFSAYQLMLKLQNVDEKKKNEIIRTLKESRAVNWVASIEGNYDIACIICIKNQSELQKVTEELYSLFGDRIIKKVLSVQVAGEFLSRDYLINQPRRKVKEPAYSPQEKTYELDSKDKMLCSLLAEDGRISYVDLAGKMKLSADAVVQRMKKLQKDNIITGSTLFLDPAKAGLLHYKVLLYLNELSESRIKKLLDSVRGNNRVMAIIKTLAEWDYEIDIEVENVEQLKEFIMGLTNEYSSIIRDYSSIRIAEMAKQIFYIDQTV